jgi:regulator of protease activity HflC (stomatin/prohibitin superfamily)
MDPFTIFILVAVIIVYKIIVVVPQEYAFVLERFGKFESVLQAGYYFLIPIVHNVRYKHTLKEVTYDIPPQECITKDNVPVEIDGVLYLKIMDAAKASYGIDNYLIATSRLAMTTLRAEIGKLNLDDTFADRDEINSRVVAQLDHATEPWGLKVTRYEIRNITPPKQVLVSMEQQMKAERDKRAEITISEGEKIGRINRSMGERKESINMSEGEKVKRINEAEGRAQEIELVATATANGLKAVATAISKKGGKEAVDLQVAQNYLEGFGKIITSSKTTVLPANMANIVAMFEGLSKVTHSMPIKGDKK